MRTRSGLVNPALGWLAAMDNREFKQHFKGSPLERTGRKRLRRNVAIAMGNSGEERFLPQLEAWASDAEEMAMLRESADWFGPEDPGPHDGPLKLPDCPCASASLASEVMSRGG